MSQVALDRAGEFSDSQPIDVVQLVRPANNAALDLPAPDTEANDPLGLRQSFGQLALGLHAATTFPAGCRRRRKLGWRLPSLRETSSRQQRPTRSPQNRTARQGVTNQEASLTIQTPQGAGITVA